jgi:hypothetical protein
MWHLFSFLSTTKGKPMNLFEKIDLFYKMAQELEENPLGTDPIEAIENTQESPKVASVKDRMAKLSKLAKR